MKGKTAFVLICILIPVLVMSFYFYNRPSKDARLRAEKKFVSLIQKNVIDEIVVYYDFKKKFIIKDKIIIKEFCNAIQLNYGERVFGGAYGDCYFLILKKNGKELYKIRYYKNIQYEHKCKKQLSTDGYYFHGKNPYNDCGQLILLGNPECDDEQISKGCSGGLIILRNLHLIPILRKYVDPFVKK